MNRAARPRRIRNHPIWSLMVARLREFIREPDAIFWVYVFPLFLVVALGVAFRNRPIETFRVGVEQNAAAGAVVGTLNADPQFRAEALDEAEGRLLLRTGKVDLYLVAQSGTPPRYDYYLDPARKESVLARDAADDVLQRQAGRRDVARTEVHAVDEPGGRYIDFLIPGLVGMGLMGGGLWGVGFAIVDMRIRKLLKRYLATPMRRSHFLIAIIASRLLFTIPEAVLLLAFARIFFGVSSLGGYAGVGLLLVLGSLEFAGIGLLVASRAQTIETVMGLMNAVMLPMWIGSGIFFSNERFPEAVQPLLRILPLTPVIRALRGVMLEGASLASLAPDLLIIVVWGVLTYALALRWFRWS